MDGRRVPAPVMFPRYILSVLSVAFFAAGSFASAQELSPRVPEGTMTDGHYVIRGLLESRQSGTCVDVGYSQCPGYNACCPTGGYCCIRTSDETLVGCCEAGQHCATTSVGLLGCCTPGINCASSSTSSAKAMSISPLLLLPAAIYALTALSCMWYSMSNRTYCN